MNIFFLDCEASSLDQDSYPIEVAWVDENGQGESYLIRPEPTWTNWSATAEALHGISRETLLRDGLPAARVAQRAREVLDGKLVASDNPAYDGHWLSCLYKLINYPEVRLHSMQLLNSQQLKRILSLVTVSEEDPAYINEARRLLSEGETIIASTINTALLQLHQEHRALSDATNLWGVWNAVRRAMDDRINRPAR